MKRSSLLLLLLLVLVITGACKSDNPGPDPSTLPAMSHKLRIRVGSDTFTATLYDNPTVTDFLTRLPLTISMVELNGNEKYYDLPQGLPAKAINPGRIQAGDLMLYGSDTLVLFYQTFTTSYSYTRMARVDNPAGLATALGRGNVSVTFELQS